jgi:arylsulfatase A-like enzyme
MGFDAPAQPDRMFGRAGQDELFAFIDEHAGKQPLFIWWAPALPHTPHDPPMRYQDLIDPEKIDVPSWLPQATPDVFRQYEHMSLAMGAWLDDEIGKLVQKLRSAGLYENTLLLFLIDNGWSNGLVAKGSPFEKGISTPLVATWPARIAPGKRSSAMIESIDLFPTILEAAGLEVPESYPGTSLLGALEGEPFQGRRTICGAIYGRGATPGGQPELDVYALYARTTRWKYIYYLGPVDEGVWSIMKITPLADMIRRRGDEDLFDLAADPLELDDLADDASRRALMDRLRAQALTWWRQSGGVPLE